MAVASIAVGSVRQTILGGDDWQRFDRRSFAAAEVISGDTLIVQTEQGPVTVRLLGIDAPDLPPAVPTPAIGAEASRQALCDLIGNKRFMLRLPQLAPRTPDGALLAYVHLDGSSLSLNDQLIAAGHAYADRRVMHAMHKQFEQAESEARRKKKGFWKEIHDKDQPAWRQEWLKSLKKGS
jgi:endonuclease YncB( thermonuclease family)